MELIKVSGSMPLSLASERKRFNPYFIHSTDGRELNVEVSDDLTASEAINELINANFIPGIAKYYKLAVLQ